MLGCSLKEGHEPDPDASADPGPPQSGPARGGRGSAAPIVLEGRYRLLVGALVRLRRSRRGRWAVGSAYGVVVVVLAALAARHFATSSWPLSGGNPSLLVAAGLLLLLAQALKALGWARLFKPDERPTPLALAAGNGGAALIGVVLPGRFDDAVRIAVVRRYPGCPAGVRALALSLVMLGLIDSAALAPLAFVAVVLPGAEIGVRVGLAVGNDRRSRCRSGDRRFAAPRREPPCSALSARPLAEPPHDVLAACVRSLGAGLRLLARPRCSRLPASWNARARLLVPARAALPLRRRRGSSAADRPGRRSDAGRCRRGGANRIRGRSLAGARGSYLGRSARRPDRSSDPPVRYQLAHRHVAADPDTAESMRSPKRSGLSDRFVPVSYSSGLGRFHLSFPSSALSLALGRRRVARSLSSPDGRSRPMLFRRTFGGCGSTLVA